MLEVINTRAPGDKAFTAQYGKRRVMVFASDLVDAKKVVSRYWNVPYERNHQVRVFRPEV